MDETTDFTFDVFLTHSAKDKAVLRDVAERLKNDGLKWLAVRAYPEFTKNGYYS